MYELEFILINDEHRSLIINSFNKVSEKENIGTLDEVLQKNYNKTVSILNELKILSKWDDPEKMHDFVVLFKAIKSHAEKYQIEYKEVKPYIIETKEKELLQELVDSAIKSGKIQFDSVFSFDYLEAFRGSIKNAKKVDINK